MVRIRAQLNLGNCVVNLNAMQDVDFIGHRQAF